MAIQHAGPRYCRHGSDTALRCPLCEAARAVQVAQDRKILYGDHPPPETAAQKSPPKLEWGQVRLEGRLGEPYSEWVAVRLKLNLHSYHGLVEALVVPTRDAADPVVVLTDERAGVLGSCVLPQTVTAGVPTAIRIMFATP